MIFFLLLWVKPVKMWFQRLLELNGPTEVLYPKTNYFKKTMALRHLFRKHLQWVFKEALALLRNLKEIIFTTNA